MLWRTLLSSTLGLPVVVRRLPTVPAVSSDSSTDQKEKEGKKGKKRGDDNEQ